MITIMGFTAGPKSISNEIHEILHTCSRHLELSVGKNSGWCSGQFSVDHFLKLTIYKENSMIDQILTMISWPEIELEDLNVFHIIIFLCYFQICKNLGGATCAF